MAISDAFVVGEDWISEHYFTTDARNESFHAQVLARRKDWDEQEAPAARSRFTERRADLERRLGALGEGGTADDGDVRALYDDLLDVLGYRTGEFVLATDGPVTTVSSPGLTGAAPLVILRAKPVGVVEDVLAKDVDSLLEPVEQEDGTTVTSVARQLSALFVSDDAPAFALVLAGRWCLVAEQERWPEGRYLAVDLLLVAERNDAKRGGEIDRALTCLEARSLGPDADGSAWWSSVLEESVKHTVGVSEDLREGVRHSIEIIANEVVARRRSQGLSPLPADQAQPLAVQSLRYLYRILFLLYAEASPELGVLPAGASEYDAGYGLDRLRELTLVDLHQQRSRQGTHLYESLHRLSRLVDTGHRPPEERSSAGADGLRFDPLRADLFRPRATALIDDVGLGNEAIQRVLRHLLLSKERKGRERGFISYVELGINQLGAVYEGLMSYTGFFATEDLYEVAKGGDPSKGSWVVPVDRADHLDDKDFVREVDTDTGESRAVRHPKGSFVFRLAGRERQQSASYYTPEVLTRFTVQQALEELLDQDDTRTSSDEILGLTVCEPALGSGAFALEAVDQLAREYLTRRQEELDRRIDPDDYPRQLQRVKAHIALHQVYGVDLNATAVELAEVSLWLDTMVEGLQAPWFGLRLRRGNSLVGARRAVYPAADVRAKAWLTAAPRAVPLADLAKEMETGGVGDAVNAAVLHFLLPAQGWGSAVEVPKSVRDLADDEVRALKMWRSSVRSKPTKPQVDRLLALTQRAEQLWQVSLRRLRIAEQESSRSLDLWGRDETPETHAVTREQIEVSLADEDGAYRRLRRVMDAWCALWFWPLTETQVDPPTFNEWVDALTLLLGRDTRDHKRGWMDTFQELTDWNQLGEAEEQDRIYSGALRTAEVLERHPWLEVCELIARQQGFFHWELDFATVFAGGGFDLQVGNPPWVRPRVELDELLAEGDPWWRLKEGESRDDYGERILTTASLPGMRGFLMDTSGATVSLASYLNAGANYGILEGQPDLYRAFMVHVWRHASKRGVQVLIHLESHFTDNAAGRLRSECYVRLRRHWQFLNELKLFEIQNQKSFGVNVYGPMSREVRFQHATGLYHPSTVTRSLDHDGSGQEPGYKSVEGEWDLTPHRRRVQTVGPEELRLWHDVLDGSGQSADAHDTPMLYTVNSTATRVLSELSRNPRLSAAPVHFSRGWNESGDQRRGLIRREWGSAPWDLSVILGTHLSAGNPYYKFPNRSMRNHRDTTLYDLECMERQAPPVTSFKVVETPGASEAYGIWGEGAQVLKRYRVAWRRRADNKGERTLVSAIIPPGASHVDGVFSAGFLDDVPPDWTPALAGFFCSLLNDFAIRAAPKSDIRDGAVGRLPVALGHPLQPELVRRVLRLNALSGAYAPLWNMCEMSKLDVEDAVLPVYAAKPPTLKWAPEVALRRAADRRNALVEIDALVALMLSVSADDLCTIYRTQFPVLYGYDRLENVYDANGRLVPNSVLAVWRRKRGVITNEECRAVHPGSGVAYTYDLPFGTLDREADMRTAYAEFERRLAAAGGAP